MTVGFYGHVALVVAWLGFFAPSALAKQESNPGPALDLALQLFGNSPKQRQTALATLPLGAS